MKLTGTINVKIPKFSRREIILAAILLFSSIAVLYYRFIFEPQWLVIKKLQVELRERQQVLDQRLRQGWNDIPWLDARSQEIKGRINDIYKIVPNMKNEPALLVDFYELARLHHLYADVIKFGELKQVEGKGYSTFNVSLEVAGDNDNIYSFIRSMEEYPRLNRLAEIKISPQSSVDSVCTLIFDIYVMHDVQQDPEVYPFMAGKYGKEHPYNIFDVYEQGDSVTYSSPEIGFPEVTPVSPENNQKVGSELPNKSSGRQPAIMLKNSVKTVKPDNQGLQQITKFENGPDNSGYIVPDTSTPDKSPNTSGFIIPYQN